MTTVELPRRFKAGRVGVSDVRTEFDGVNPWTTRWTGADRDIPMALGTGGGYVYRIDQRGWVEPGPSAPGDQLRFVQQGHRFLHEYGEHEATGTDGIYIMHNPHEMLFRLGGQKLMPPEQVISCGYAVRPPIVDGQPLWKDSPVEAFPQLEGVDIPPLRTCPYCPRQLWTDEAEQNHVSVMHADRLAAFEQSRAIADGMERAIGVGKSTPAPQPAVATTPAAAGAPISASAAVEFDPAMPYRCTWPGCEGAAFAMPLRLAQHVNATHKKKE